MDTDFLLNKKRSMRFAYFFPFIFSLLFIGCNGSKSVQGNSAKELPVPALSESMQMQKLNGVDFYAKGDIPVSWNLEMDFGNTIRFKALDGAAYNSSSAKPVEIPGSKTVSYTTKTTDGEMIILVAEGNCEGQDAAAGFNKKVTIKVNGKQYDGCGQYIFDAALNGGWTLEKINNVALNAASFAKGLPLINIQLATNKVSGNDGCNAFSGAMEVQGNNIKFGPIISTKMACPGIIKEFEFVGKLSDQYSSYSFTAEGKLILSLIDDSSMEWRRGK